MAGKGPTVVGLINSLAGLLTPARFVAAQPSRIGVPYRDGVSRGIAPLADIYLPGGPPPWPSVVIVHGGGFVVGHRQMKAVRFLATRLVNTGHAVAAIDYRLIFRGGRVAEAVEDVGDAIDWWIEQDEVPLLKDRVTAVGLSAGATLAHLALLQNRARVRRLVSFFGAYDFESMQTPLGAVLRHFLLGAEPPGKWSPVQHAAKFTMPITYLHGTEDGVVPIDQAHTMVAALQQAGHDNSVLHTYHGLRHGFLNQSDHPQVLNAVEVLIEQLHRDGSSPVAGRLGSVKSERQ